MKSVVPVLLILATSEAIYGRCPFSPSVFGKWAVSDAYGNDMNTEITINYYYVMVRSPGVERVFFCKEMDYYETVLLITPEKDEILCLQFPFVDENPMLVVRLSPTMINHWRFFEPTRNPYRSPTIGNTCNRYSDGDAVFLNRMY
ncbi:uncharacterized protein LOC128191195 isoform X2 [Crassostrea angulata]|uniref:Salivary lipocalin n=1 Tax=Magallana gigas TaxID=29159 RepID=A0A8W8ML16_MAGGI|nr:uncharacterized protein LOC117686550 isoform X2 [Crassostrea gigas]XP_052719240.1 uncharacterized protein LOC128191195 isoform X2 [Crassostrea angulata]